MSVSVELVESEPVKLFLRAATHDAPPASRCALQYLDEGGANFVFRIVPIDGKTGVPPRLREKLLRLRKDLSHVPTAEEHLLAVHENFGGLFTQHDLIQHELIVVDERLLALLNKQLQDAVRPRRRLHDRLPIQEMSGLLMTDLTPKADDVLVQLKPKWLMQSPTAPEHAKRCRTCAVRAQRTSEGTRTATDNQETCPLMLVSESLEQRKRAVSPITSDPRLQEYLLYQAQPLLQQLRTNQAALDKDGVLHVTGNEQIRALCKAMTLRDCTLFLRKSGDTVEARIGDLDLKRPQMMGKWKAIESMLIDNGWYTNTEHSGNWVDENVCLLSRKSFGRN